MGAPMHGMGNRTLLALAPGLTFAGARPASALTKEQAREHCRNTVGRPIVGSCVRRAIA